MKYLRSLATAAAVALAAFLPSLASAQTVMQQPAYIDAGTIVDFGNGPLRFQTLSGTASIFTASGSSTATAGAAAQPNITVALNISPPPCVGCGVSGIGVPTGTTVVSYTAGTGVIVTSANLTIAATGNVYSFGTACPATTAGMKPALIGSGLNVPFWTAARLCGATAGGQGGASVAVSSVNSLQ